ncbi:hypothetical protein MMC28_004027 [Mycoblastus sanguinarius]|nr:hypothetical protein [Mycoblastus sanguinarius]
MKSYTAELALSAVAFLALIQPCPAPPLVVGIVAGTTMGAGAATAGAYAAGHHRAMRRQNDPSFNDCISQGVTSQQQINFLANSSIVVSGLPQACMGEIESYNAHPQAAQMNTVHGSTTVLNSTSVSLDGMPDYVVTAIKEAQAQASASPQKRSPFTLEGACDIEGLKERGIDVTGDCQVVGLRE